MVIHMTALSSHPFSSAGIDPIARRNRLLASVPVARRKKLLTSVSAHRTTPSGIKKNVDQLCADGIRRRLCLLEAAWKDVEKNSTA